MHSHSNEALDKDISSFAKAKLLVLGGGMKKKTENVNMEQERNFPASGGIG